MKKFLAILTIVAMLSGMVVIGASADTSTYAFDVDFDEFEDYGSSTKWAHQNCNSVVGTDSISHFGKGMGVYGQGYSNMSDKTTPQLKRVSGKSENPGDYAISSNNIWIKVPEFFKDKQAGTYTLSFDYKKIDNTNGLSVIRIDPGATTKHKDGSGQYIYGTEGFTGDIWTGRRVLISAADDVEGWQSKSFNFEWNGKVSEITDFVKNRTYDKYALGLKFTADGAFALDNIRISSSLPEKTDLLVESKVVIPEAGKVTFKEDFSAYTGGWGNTAKTFSWDPTVETFVGRKSDTYEGVHYASAIAGTTFLHWQTPVNHPYWHVSKNDYPQECGFLASNGFAVRIPGFFANKKEGNYTVSFKVNRSVATKTTARNSLKAYVLDVGASVNAGATTWVNNANGIDFKTSNVTDWTNVSITVPYSGNTTAITKDGVTASDFDTDALCIYVTGLINSGTMHYLFDDIVIESTPFVSKKATPTAFRGEEMTINNIIYNNINSNGKMEKSGVVINALYDDDDNLIKINAVENSNFTLTTADDYVEVPATLDIPDDVASNWKYKTFVWSDLDNEIEPLADYVDIFEANIFNGGFEIMSKTTAPTVAGRDNVSRYWEADANAKVVADTTDKVDGVYSVKLTNATSQSGPTLYSNRSEDNNVVYDLFSKYGPGKYTFEICVKFASGGTLTPMMYIYDGTNKIGCRPKDSSGSNVGLTPQAANIWREEELGDSWVKYVYTIDTTLFNVSQCVPSDQNGLAFTTWAGTTYAIDNFSFVGFEAAE